MSIPKSSQTPPPISNAKNAPQINNPSGLAGSNKKADSAIQSCPLKKENNSRNTEKPCDVETLSITAGKRSVNTNQPRHRRKSPVKASIGLPKDKASLMSGYDMVLEVLAPVRLKAEDQNAGLPLVITESHHGDCVNGEHPCVSVTPSGLGPQDTEQPVSVVMSSLAPYNVWGKSLNIDSSKSGFLVNCLAEILPFGSKSVKDVKVTTDSCGVRLSSAVKNSYVALVRVYRKEDWSLSFSSPPIVKVKHERKFADVYVPSNVSVPFSKQGETKVKSQDPFSVTSSKETSIALGGETVSQNKQTYDKDGLASGQKTFKRSDGQIVEGTKKRGEPLTVNLVDVEMGLISTKTVKTNVYGVPSQTKQEVTPRIVLKRNGEEFNFTKVINDMLVMAKAVKDGFNAIKAIVPKVGFFMSLDIGVLEGKITGNWGVRPDASLDSAEYKWVMPYFDVNLQVVLLSVDFSVMFGIDIKSPSLILAEEGWLYQVTFKVELKLTFSVDVTASINLTGAEDSDKEEKKPFKGVGVGVFKGVAQATLLGTSGRAEAGSKITLTMTANLNYGLACGFYFDWNLARSAWVIYAEAQGSDGEVNRLEEEIWEKAPNWRSGTIFKN